MAITKVYRRNRIRNRIRKIVSGTAERPRLSVFRSNKHIFAQLIDDVNGTTLASASSVEKTVLEVNVNKTEKAALVGKLLAEKAKNVNVASVVFDRGGYLYHGRVKSFADAAREGGLIF
jgi:large subunit ribosomal protein L18